MSAKFKFKVGDRVVAIKDASPFKVKGKHGVIIKCDSSFDHLDYGVEFDEYIGGHNCGGFPGNDGKTGYCAWISVDGVVAEKSSDNWKVVITPDGDKTIGKLIENGKTVKEVTTKKHPDDEYDMNYAIKVVTERLAEPKYYNGKIVCVSDGLARDCLTVGKIYTVVDGYCKDDQGRMMFMKPVTSFDEIKTKFATIKFIEVVE